MSGFPAVNVTFERRLRAAVSAGWRVLVVEVALLTVVWVIHLAVMGAHPRVVLSLWGSDVSWSTVAAISLQAIAVYKVALWLQAALLAWGALWANTLRKLGAETAEPRSESALEQEPSVRRRPVSAGS
jgi:hypothetical protein